MFPKGHWVYRCSLYQFYFFYLVYKCEIAYFQIKRFKHCITTANNKNSHHHSFRTKTFKINNTFNLQLFFINFMTHHYFLYHQERRKDDNCNYKTELDSSIFPIIWIQTRKPKGGNKAKLNSWHSKEHSKEITGSQTPSPRLKRDKGGQDAISQHLKCPPPSS